MRNHFLRAAAGSSTSGFPGVTDNLAVHWDFGNSDSWSGGTAVTDLTGNGNGGTLVGNTGSPNSTDFSALLNFVMCRLDNLYKYESFLY